MSRRSGGEFRLRRPDRPSLWLGGACACAVFLAWGCGHRQTGGPAEAGPAAPPAAYETHMAAAREQAAAGNDGAALAELRKASAAAPAEVAPHSLSADILANSNRQREALDEMRQAHRLAPNDPAITLKLLDYTPPYLPAAETEALARLAVSQAPDNPRSHYLLGLAIENGNDPRRQKEALAELLESNRLSPTQPDTLVAMGRLYSRTGDSLRAVAALESAWQILEKAAKARLLPATELTPMRRNAAFWLAQAYRQEGDTAKARAMQTEVAALSAQARETVAQQARARALPPGR